MRDKNEHLRGVEQELQDLCATIGKLRGAIALRRTSGPDEGKAASLRQLDGAAQAAAAIRGAVRSLRTDLTHLEAHLERAEREASHHKAKRAEATAKLIERDRQLRDIHESAAWKTVKPWWKLGRRRRETARAAQPTDDLAFAVDWPNEWTTSREILLIKGWCFSLSGREVAGIRAKIGSKGRIGRYGIERKDIAAQFDNDDSARRSGFTIELRVPRGKSTVILEAIVQGGEWRPFYQHELISVAEAENGVSTVARKVAVGSQRRVSFPTMTASKATEFLRPRFSEHARVASDPPVFSIITPAFNTRASWFTEAAVSLLDQTFANWEWCVVDDGSTDAETRKLLLSLADASPRLRIQTIANAGISAATNAALDLATGEFVGFLDHDDLLDPAALQLAHNKFKGGCDVIYSDEDKLEDGTGKFVEPFFKPDWSPEYFRGVMYVGHFLCLRRTLAQGVRFDPAFNGVQDFEFMLRVSETGAKICHLPELLYHWRKTAGSIAQSTEAKPHISELQMRAVNAHLGRLGLPASAEPAPLPHRLQILPHPRHAPPPISIIIPTKDAPDVLARCLESISSRTRYPEFEVILIDNDTTDARALEVMEQYPVRRIPFAGHFNFSRANNLGAANAGGEFLVFLNNDTEIVTEDWLQHLLYYAEQPDVGAAGALLIYADQTVQHGGVALGMRGTADHLMRGFPLDVDGYAGSLPCSREVSAVTAACLMISKSRFDEVGGFNEHFFTAYQDLDLCLRLRARDLRVIYTPRAVVVHHEWTSRKTYYDMVDRALLLDQWESVIERGDPYYHRELNLERGDYSLRQNR